MSPELVRFVRRKYPIGCNVAVGSLLTMYPARVIAHLDDGSVKLEVQTPSGMQQKVITLQDENEMVDPAEDRFFL
jgi:hypothetical protein